MSSQTVAKRTFASTPARDAAQTWVEIVELLTQGKSSADRNELLSIEGVAASIIADRYPQKSAIKVTCKGPQTRIYCIYDEDAVDGSDANETALGYDALAGDWHMSLPCHVDDLSWVTAALSTKTSKITARDPDAEESEEETASNQSQSLEIDKDKFLNS